MNDIAQPDAEAVDDPGLQAELRATLTRQVVWFGLIGGFAELVALGVQDAIRLTVTVDDIRTNHHYVWMIPISALFMIAVVGGILAFLGEFFPKTVRSLSPYIFGFLACLMPLMAIRGLHPIARLLLAMGLASRIGPVVNAHSCGFRSVVRYSLPAMLTVLALLIGIKGSSVLLAERRAIAKLPAARTGAKNVLLLVMDNVRADHLSLHGYARDTSPALEKLAKRGIRFDRARSPAPWTLPSHASMLTGLWPHQLSTTIDTPLDNSYPTLAETLASQGYLTGGFVANTYYCNAWYGLDRGFSRYEDFPQNRQIDPYEILRSSRLGDLLLTFLQVELASPGDKDSRKTAETINDSLLNWIDARGDRPFFAFVNYYDAHEPFTPPDGYPRQYGMSTLDEPSRRAISKRFRNLSRGLPNNPELGSRSHDQIVDEANRLLVDGYDDCIHYLDEQIGKLITNLEARGLLDSTIVILTSDHGEHFGEHGLFGHGNSVYRPLIDVPLVVLAPGLSEQGRVVTDLASPRDVAATILDLCGAPAGSRLPGSSLARFWSPNREPNEEDDVPLSHVGFQPKLAPAAHIPAANGVVWAITAQGRTYIRNQSGREELYNQVSDPDELTDLSGKATEKNRLDALRSRLDQLLAPHAPTPLARRF